jgi:hypothetical protein
MRAVNPLPSSAARRYFANLAPLFLLFISSLPTAPAHYIHGNGGAVSAILRNSDRFIYSCEAGFRRRFAPEQAPGEWVGLAAKIPKKIAELTLPLSADWPANSDQRARTHPDDDPGKPRQTTHSAFRRSGREKKADDSYELLGKNRS